MKFFNPLSFLKGFITIHWPVGPKLWVYFVFVLLIFGLLPLFFVNYTWFGAFFIIWMFVYLFIMYLISYLISNQSSTLDWKQMHRDKIKRYEELTAILHNFYYFKLLIWLGVIRAFKAGLGDIIVAVCIFFVIIMLFSLYVFLIREHSSEHYWSTNLWDYQPKK